MIGNSEATGRVGRLVRSHVGIPLSLWGAWLIFNGRFGGLRSYDAQWLESASLVAMLALLGWRLLVGRPTRTRPLVEQLDRLELGWLALVCAYGGIQLAGGPASDAQAVAYVVVVYLVGFNAPVMGLVLTATALLLQTALHYGVGEMPHQWQHLAIRSGYLVLFSTASWFFLQAEVARHRRAHQRRLAEEMRAMREDAKDFRLISSSLTSDGDRRALEEAKLARGAVDAIHQSMFFLLNLLKRSLDLQTCVVLWLDASGRQLRIKELVSDSEAVRETPIPAQTGALGGVVKNRLLLNLRRPRRGAQGIPYYASSEEVGAFVGVPIIEEGHLRGVLCADRRQDASFTGDDEKVLVDAAQQVLCGIQTERVLAAVERSKYEHERFYRASTQLNHALTLAQVYQTALDAARGITEFDFAAITLYDRDRQKHTICKVHVVAPDGGFSRSDRQRERLEGQEFGDNAGLVSMVVKNRHFLPTGRGPAERETTVFTRRLKLHDAQSLVVLPLLVKDYAIGTIVLAARAPGRFTKQIREMLGVIGNQVAVSIENAKMYKRMEEMATTDGLTGLPNHRTFQARCGEMLARAERHAKPVSVVLSDVDKFKGVNDTYGHPVGDQVLKRVAKVLAEEVRKVDVVARYGGEEFAIVLEETDNTGARLLCERVRKQMAAQVLNSDKGGFRVTISLGIASYPADGSAREQLIERADQALYAAKRAGRNRTMLYSEIRRRARGATG